MSRTLVINADDFGLSTSVNAGIVEAHTHGVLTATTWLAGGDAAEEAAALARTVPQLDVGLHLALNGVLPCAPAKVVGPLLSGPRFPPRYPPTARRLLASPAARRAAEAEWTAQYDRFRALFGRAPVHVDSHQHIALLPPLWRPFLQLARAHGVRFVRAPMEIAHLRELRGPRLFAALAMSALAWRFRRQARQAGLRVVDHFTGFRLSGRLQTADALAVVAALRPGVTELMVHPGASDTADGYARRTELDALMSPSLADALARFRIRLTRFSDL